MAVGDNQRGCERPGPVLRRRAAADQELAAGRPSEPDHVVLPTDEDRHDASGWLPHPHTDGLTVNRDVVGAHPCDPPPVQPGASTKRKQRPSGAHPTIRRLNKGVAPQTFELASGIRDSHLASSDGGRLRLPRRPDGQQRPDPP
jgi:hypothetical protein